MTRVEVIIILSVVFLLLYLRIRIEKSNRVKRISIDEVANLSSKEQEKLLHKERIKLTNLLYQYDKAGYWKGVVHKYFVPDLEKRIKIEKAIEIVEDNIVLLEDVIYRNKI